MNKKSSSKFCVVAKDGSRHSKKSQELRLLPAKSTSPAKSSSSSMGMSLNVRG